MLVERKTDKNKFVFKEVVRGIRNKEKAEENEEVRILKSLKDLIIVTFQSVYFLYFPGDWDRYVVNIFRQERKTDAKL